jgi:hypothetical protein
MPRQTAGVEVNAFVKGLVTEASPLTFPDNASLDEMNMVLNKDGSRRRRLGMDYESGYALIDSGQASDPSLTFTPFVWKQPGGYTDKEFLVIQSGTRITILDSTIKPISSSIIGQYNIGSSVSKKMSMASVDGIMVVTTGDGNIYGFDYNGSGITTTTGRLKIRDLFGVADTIGSFDYLDGSGISTRPSTLTQAHTYNLRNQTFSVPRKLETGLADATEDPIRSFFVKSGSTVYPANSDNLVSYLYSDANNASDRNIKRYFASDNFVNQLGTNRAPLGYFIIDAMNRGASRLSEYAKLLAANPLLAYGVNSLPQDLTPGGASVLTSYAGRIWYGGFSAQLVGGDSESPRMTSYILFSRLVQNISDIYKCYQEGDPTSAEIPDLVDTDGGFLRIDGAYNIQGLVNVGEALMVVAENGVWKITGGSGYGFKATDYLTSKITEHGCISPGSITIVDNTFMYWSDDGIYHINQNQYGDWVGTNITTATIQTLFDNIPYLAKVRCQGAYDSYQRQIRWMYNNYFDADPPKELVLDVNLTAFYQTELKAISPGQLPRPLAIVKVPPFTTTSKDATVLNGVGNTVVNASINNVIISQKSVVSQTSELYYIVADSISGGTVRLTLAYYRDDEFTDWVSKDGIGIDAKAYLLTGYASGGDFQRQKQVPYITVYSKKTEIGFTDDYVPINPSSIIVQGQWGWTNLAASNKWTNKFQAYRHVRFWAPPDASSGFDDGESVVTTRNKLRGRGRVLSLLFETEPKKDFHLFGWSYVITVNQGL